MLPTPNIPSFFTSNPEALPAMVMVWFGLFVLNLEMNSAFHKGVGFSNYEIPELVNR